MKKENWQNGQPVITNDLLWASDSKEEAIKERLMDFISKGVVDNSQLSGESIPFEIYKDDDTHFTVKTGVGFTSLGERILIKDLTTTYNPNNPNMTSGDGHGNQVPTPQSTGNLYIPIVNQPNSTIYVWITYLNTVSTDPQWVRLGDDQQTLLYVRNEDGYKIEQTISSTPYDNEKSILIGTIALDSQGKINAIDYSLREKATISAKKISGSVGSTLNRPSDYQGTISIQDHLYSVGTGRITPFNPHGLSAQDLNIELPEGKEHQSKFHTSGIFSSEQNSTSSALYGIATVESATNEDIFKIKALSSLKNEGVLINGTYIDPNVLNTDVSFSFKDSTTGSPLAEGLYLFVLDSSDKIIKRLGPFNDESDLNYLNAINNSLYLPLWKIWWVSNPNPENPDNYDLVDQRDLRVFGNTSEYNIQGHVINGLIEGFSPTARETTLYYARLIGSVSNTLFNVSNESISIKVDNGDAQNYTFIGSGPLSIDEVIRQLNELNGLLAEKTIDNKIKLLAKTKLEITDGTALNDLGFTRTNDSGFIREIKSTGNLVPTSIEIYYTQADPNAIDYLIFSSNNKRIKEQVTYDSAGNVTGVTTVQI
jgi:hypothetical protein